MLYQNQVNSIFRSTLIFLSFVPLSHGSDGDFCHQNDPDAVIRNTAISTSRIELTIKEPQSQSLEDFPSCELVSLPNSITFSPDALIKHSPPQKPSQNLHHSLSPRDLFNIIDTFLPSTSLQKETLDESTFSQSCPNLPLRITPPPEDHPLSKSDSQIPATATGHSKKTKPFAKPSQTKTKSKAHSPLTAFINEDYSREIQDCVKETNVNKNDELSLEDWAKI